MSNASASAQIANANHLDMVLPPLAMPIAGTCLLVLANSSAGDGCQVMGDRVSCRFTDSRLAPVIFATFATFHNVRWCSRPVDYPSPADGVEVQAGWGLETEDAADFGNGRLEAAWGPTDRGQDLPRFVQPGAGDKLFLVEHPGAV